MSSIEVGDYLIYTVFQTTICEPPLIAVVSGISSDGEYGRLVVVDRGGLQPRRDLSGTFSFSLGNPGGGVKRIHYKPDDLPGEICVRLAIKQLLSR